MWELALFVFLVIVVIIIFLIVICWPKGCKKENKDKHKRRNNYIAGLDEVCSNNIECQTGLTCDPDLNVCKLSIGERCTTLDQCTSEANVCNGFCSISTNPGELNQPCPPCNVGLVCVDMGGETGSICKLTENQPCTINSDCQSNLCFNGLCEPLRKAGESCSVGQCETGLQCSIGFCQNIGVVSGTNGAVCVIGDPAPPAGAGCNTNLICLSSNGSSGVSSSLGTCSSATQEFGEVCDISLPCIPPFVCPSTQDTQICLYPDDPNSCPTTVCSKNYTCSSIANEGCIGSIGSPCTSAENCQTGICGASTLVFWAAPVNGQLNINQNSGWTQYATIPTGVVFDSIYAQSGFFFDTIWALSTQDNDLGGGLYRLSGINGTWTLIIEQTVTDSTYTYSLKNFIISDITVYVSAKVSLISSPNTTNDGLFTVNIQAGSLIPFNTTLSGLPGTQYVSTNPIITINSFDISPSSSETLVDVIIQGSTSAIPNRLFTKPFSTKTYTMISVNGIQPRFYSGKVGSTPVNNFAYLVSGTPNNPGYLLTFSGDISSTTPILYPQQNYSNTKSFNVIAYDIFVASNNPLGRSAVWMLSSVSPPENPATPFTMFQILNLDQYQIPGYFDSSSSNLISNTGRGVYTITSGSCSTTFNFSDNLNLNVGSSTGCSCTGSSTSSVRSNSSTGSVRSNSSTGSSTSSIRSNSSTRSSGNTILSILKKKNMINKTKR